MRCGAGEELLLLLKFELSTRALFLDTGVEGAPVDSLEELLLLPTLKSERTRVPVLLKFLDSAFDRFILFLVEVPLALLVLALLVASDLLLVRFVRSVLLVPDTLLRLIVPFSLLEIPLLFSSAYRFETFALRLEKERPGFDLS